MSYPTKIDKIPLERIDLRFFDNLMMDFMKENFYLEAENKSVEINVVFEAMGLAKKVNRLKPIRDKKGKLILPSVIIYSPDVSEDNSRFVVHDFNRTNFMIKKELSSENYYSKNNPKLYDVYTIPFPRFIKLNFYVELWTQRNLFKNQFREFILMNPFFYLCYKNKFYFSTQSKLNKPSFDSQPQVSKPISKMSANFMVDGYILRPKSKNDNFAMKHYVTGGEVDVNFNEKNFR